MLRSMTGYGRGHAVNGRYDITVEVKSVNHRYFEFTSRLPKAYLFLEDRLKHTLKGEQEITPLEVEALDKIFSLHADHGRPEAGLY